MNPNLTERFNVSEKYKSLLWLPERTGSGTTAKIMSHYDFKCGDYLLIDKNRWGYTHHCGINSQYKDYTLISTARNPYSRVLSIYKSLSGYPEELKGNTQEKFKKYLQWVYSKNNNELHYDYITNPRIGLKSQYLIRLEHLEEDYIKIPFIFDVFSYDELKSKLIYHKKIDDWQHFYDEYMKNIVYDMCKIHFHIWGYEK